MAIRFEYYNTGDDGFEDIGTVVWEAQTFTPSISHKITSVKLKLFRSSTPGTVTVGIRVTDESGHPTSDDLCVGTTNGDTLTTNTAGEWREITLGGGYNLLASTKYAIVIRVAGIGSAYWRVDLSSPTYSGGNAEKSIDTGSSWNSLSRDFMFEEWGEKQAPLPMHFRS